MKRFCTSTDTAPRTHGSTARNAQAATRRFLIGPQFARHVTPSFRFASRPDVRSWSTRSVTSLTASLSLATVFLCSSGCVVRVDIAPMSRKSRVFRPALSATQLLRRTGSNGFGNEGCCSSRRSFCNAVCFHGDAVCARYASEQWPWKRADLCDTSLA